MQNLKGLAEVAANYDGILFDIYGIIHNGVACFDGVIDTLSSLKAAGIPYAFLSNMPLRAARVTESLMRRGTPENLANSALSAEGGWKNKCASRLRQHAGDCASGLYRGAGG